MDQPATAELATTVPDGTKVQGQRAASRERTVRSKLILQVWVYTFCIWAGVGLIVAVLADNFHLFIPIAVLSVLVGGVGTLLAFQRTATGPRTGPASIFH